MALALLSRCDHFLGHLDALTGPKGLHSLRCGNFHWNFLKKVN